MGDLKYSDNAESKLTSAINNVDDPATFSITAGEGATFPALTGNQWFPLVVVDATGNYEKMKVTARSVDSITATRAQGGTTKIAFASGDAVYMCPTSEFFDEYPQLVDLQDGKPHWCGTAGGTVNAITMNADPTLAAYATGQLFTFKANGNNTAAVTVNIDGIGVKTVVNLEGGALAADSIVADGHYFIQYDGTEFFLMNSFDPLTDAEIKTQYENNADTNAFTDSDEAHLDLTVLSDTTLDAQTSVHINNMVKMTQAAWNAETKDADTLYIIVG
jgi:hypothetical protein